MVVNWGGFLLPRSSADFEVTDLLFLLGIYADDGLAAACKRFSHRANVVELPVSLLGLGRVAVAGLDLLVVDPQGVSELLEQAPHGL